MKRARRPLLDRIVAKLDVGDCWVFTGATIQGYGSIGAGGSGRINGTVRTHRAVWEILVGPIPPGMQLDHLCRVRACCNPDHLQVVTPAENVRRGTAGAVNRARQGSKTACPLGHPYDETNTYWTSRGGRQCRTCKCAAVAAYAARNRELLAERSRAWRRRQKETAA